MKIAICFIVYTILTLFFGVRFTYAAFPVQQDARCVISVEAGKSLLQSVNTSPQQLNSPVPFYDGSERSPGLSIASLCLGVAGFIGLLLALSMPLLFVIIPVSLSIAAIVLGALGRRRARLRGLGDAGFVLGIVNLSLAAFVGLLILLAHAML